MIAAATEGRPGAEQGSAGVPLDREGAQRQRILLCEHVTSSQLRGRQIETRPTGTSHGIVCGSGAEGTAVLLRSRAVCVVLTFERLQSAPK
jgi:hypothetical protein